MVTHRAEDWHRSIRWSARRVRCPPLRLKCSSVAAVAIRWRERGRAGMTDKTHGHRGREETTAAILDAAEELFSARGYTAVTVRAIAERAGISHALVHRYLGSKADIYRAVLRRQEDAILQAAPDDPDLLASASLMFRQALAENRRYVRLIAHSALHGLSYEQVVGQVRRHGSSGRARGRRGRIRVPGRTRRQRPRPPPGGRSGRGASSGLGRDRVLGASRGGARRRRRRRAHRRARSRDPRDPQRERAGSRGRRPRRSVRQG